MPTGRTKEVKMNEVYLTGTFERTIRVNTVQGKDGSTKVAVFNVKTSRGKAYDYLKCEAWGNEADLVEGLQSGQFVFIRGYMRTNTWKDGDKTRYDQVVRAQNVCKLDVSVSGTPQNAVYQAPVQQAAAPVEQVAPAQPQQATATTITDNIPF